jgi:hypothetical protein
LASLGTGIANGNPGQIFGGLLNSAQSAARLFPGVASAVGNFLGLGGTAGATAADLAAMGATGAEMGGLLAEAGGNALSTGLGTVAGMAAPFIQAATAFVGNEEMLNARNSGWWNNPIKGNLYSASTAGTYDAQQILDQIEAFGGAGQIPADQLLQAIGPLFNGLRPYYDTAQGGRGAIKASDTVTGGSGGMKNQPYGGDSPEAYTARFAKAQQGTAGVLQSLLDRGVPYETIGRIPLQGNWASQMLDVQDPLDAFYQRAQATPGIADQGTSLLHNLYSGATQVPIMDESGSPTGRIAYSYGSQPIPVGLPLEALFGGAQGSDRFTDPRNPGGDNVAAMYGGPVWTALARMGPEAGGQGIQDLIQQHFNPWARAGGWSGADLANATFTYQQPQGYFERPENFNTA